MSALCKDCGAEFEISEAARRKGTYVCKHCRAVRSKADYARRKAAGLRVSGTRVSREHYRAWYAEYSKQPEFRARRAAAARERVRNPAERHKHEARWQTRRAIASGKLVRQPCEKCGEAKVHAHHDDYSKPLDVRWLCPTHHREHHARARGEHD